MLMNYEDYLESLRSRYKAEQKNLDKEASETGRKLMTYGHILNSRQSSEAEKVRASLGKTIEYETDDRRDHDMILLGDVLVLANYVDVLRETIDFLAKQIEESGVLDKVKDIDNIAELAKMVKAAKERYEKSVKQRKKDEKNRKDLKDKLSYIK